ncbi:MAG: response regulator [Bacteroidia bacterium]
MPYIIHIDDNEIDRLILNRSLKKQLADLEIKSVSSVASAEAYLDNIGKSGVKMPDLIITDNNMPEKSGFEFVETIKANDKLKQIPIVMLSSSNLDKDIAKALSLGVHTYLAKPLNPGTVKQILKFVEDKNQ